MSWMQEVSLAAALRNAAFAWGGEGSHSSWAGQLGRRFPGEPQPWLAAQHPARLTEIGALQRRGQRAARLGAPQGSTWTGTAGCSSNATDSQPSLQIG